MTPADPGYAPVYELTRGRIVESLHFGAAAVVDSTGRLLASIGDPYLTTFLRSSAKPFQALPFIEAGGHEHFHFSQKQIALICASHAGTDDHVETAESIQQAAGFSMDNLQCGVHEPMDVETRRRRNAAGLDPTQNHHNCSGKHSGMLASACFHGYTLENYLDPDHPHQQNILAAFSEMCGLPANRIEIGVDGCSAPNFAVPLYNAALAFARMADPSSLSPPRAAACRTITGAMTAFPDMVAGPKRFDTQLMAAANHRLFAKGGAEGYQGVGVFGGKDDKAPAIGIAVKISDGAFRSLLPGAVVLEMLKQLGALGQEAVQSLQDFGPIVTLRNFKEKTVGQGRPLFTLSST